MDWTPAERAGLLGYKPSPERRAAVAASAPSFLQMNAAEAGTASLNSTVKLGITGGLSANEGPPIRDQGDCGGCWAISAVEAVEAQLGSKVRLSAQALVNCVPNPHHCGGKGGCDGATAELAYQFIQEVGIPLEDELHYSAKTETCSVNVDQPWPVARRVRLQGWRQLPTNQAEPFMQALVQDGPAVVAVAADTWFNYNSGVFNACKKDAVISHAVLAKGFGEDNGHKYYLIQNSWGSDWGERGHIRLARSDNEDEWCGVDNKPEEGLGCDGGPKSVKICGQCGILFDTSVPQGAELQHGTAPTMSALSTVIDSSTQRFGEARRNNEDGDGLLQQDQPGQDALLAVFAQR
jgi:hypothetical protein